MELEKLKAIIAEVAGLHAEEITLDATLSDLGLDSLDVYQIVTGIEQEFDIEVEPERAEGLVTIGDAVALIREMMEE